MKIQLNGESRGIGVGQTVAGLLRELDIRTDRVAVELNLDIVRPERLLYPPAP